MNTALLDINDRNLQLWHAEHRLQGPGYALLDGQQYRFGLVARAAARLRPRDINSRYWWQLNTEPLQPALGPARHTADLVHAHLLDMFEQAGKPEKVVLATSASMQKEQLALLLGIIEHCPFSAVGLVNRSVALASLYGGSSRLYHLEIQLHQAVISELGHRQGSIELERTVTLPGCGWMQLQDRLAEIIGKACIRQTRFDPRLKAATEQQLYDLLPVLLHAFESTDEYQLKIAGYHVRISRDELEIAAATLLSSTVGAIGTAGGDDPVMLDPAAAMLPGFSRQFSHALCIDDKLLCEAVAQHQDRLIQREQPLIFVTTLPCLAVHAEPNLTMADTNPVGTNPARPDTPTHLLANAHAKPLLASGTIVDTDCELHRLAGHWQLRGNKLESVRINGVAYQPGQPVYCGDNISTSAGTQVRLIKVTD